MCNSNSKARFFAPGGGTQAAMSQVDIPKIKKPRTDTEAEKRKKAAERARIAALRAKGGYSHADTNVTGGKLGGAPAPTATQSVVGS